VDSLRQHGDRMNEKGESGSQSHQTRLAPTTRRLEMQMQQITEQEQTTNQPHGRTACACEVNYVCSIVTMSSVLNVVNGECRGLGEWSGQQISSLSPAPTWSCAARAGEHRQGVEWPAEEATNSKATHGNRTSLRSLCPKIIQGRLDT